MTRGADRGNASCPSRTLRGIRWCYSCSPLIPFCLCPEQQALWAEFVAIEVEPSNDNYAAACEVAAKLVLGAWIKYLRPGTEQPYKYICYCTLRSSTSPVILEQTYLLT